VLRGTSAVRRTDLGGWVKGKLTGARPSMTMKSGSGDSTSAGRRGVAWLQWSGRRASGHRDRACGRAGGTGQWSEQAVYVEALSGSNAKGNRSRRRCTAVVGIGGRVREVACARTDLEEASAGRFAVRVG
jgi:hypothetical protein